jgi:hypothetical protein
MEKIIMAIAKNTGVAYTIPPNLKGSGSNSDSGTATRIGSSSTNLTNVSVTRAQTTVFGSTALDDAYADKALSAGTFRYDDQRPVGMRVSSTLAGVSKTALRSGAGVPGQTRSINKRESFKVSKISTAYRNGYWNPYNGNFSAYGTYSRTGYTVTVTAASHGLVTGDFVKLDFTSGAATDGSFSVTRVDANSFTLTHTATGSTTGNVTVAGYSSNTESPGTDVAATPTRSAPGQLTYKLGQPVPVSNNDYKAKTG